MLPTGEERPIAFASRTLNKSERNYAQIEKEALSIIFGIMKFHQYLYGRKFLLVTDHKPLVTILGPKRGIPTLAAARLQRWAILLSAYQYDIEYRSTAKHANADCLSRLPLQIEKPEDVDEVRLVNILQIESLPLSAEQIRKATRADPVLSRVLEYTLKDWLEERSPEIAAYYQKRHEITIEDGCLVWGIRVIVPKPFHERVLKELHSGHPGIVRMKSLARLHVWWPNLDKDILSVVRGCVKCQLTRNKPPQAPLQPWDWPKLPWQRIHIDFAGPFMNRTFLIVVDSHSKWLEVEVMSSVTSEATIEKLREMFARFGIPMQLVSDNGPQFTSREFAEFTKANGIKHTLVAPYHPRSNGQAERFVQTFKQYFKTEGSNSIKQSLSRFLFSYRTTPSSVTGQTPAELFLNRRPRTRLDLLLPDLGRKVFEKQIDQKAIFDRTSKERHFSIGEEVLVQNFRGESKWIEGTVAERTGPVSYRVIVGDQIWKRHVDQIREKTHANRDPERTSSPLTDIDSNTFTPTDAEPIQTPTTEQREEVVSANASNTSDSNSNSSVDNTNNSDGFANASGADTNASPVAEQPPQTRYPSRNRKPPTRLGFDQ